MDTLLLSMWGVICGTVIHTFNSVFSAFSVPLVEMQGRGKRGAGIGFKKGGSDQLYCYTKILV